MGSLDLLRIRATSTISESGDRLFTKRYDALIDCVCLLTYLSFAIAQH